MTTLKKAKGSNYLGNLFMVIFLFLTVSFASAQDADYDFSGNWKSNQGPVVLISKSGDTFKGENVEHNKLVLEDLKYTDGEWKGVLIKPQDGSKYDCTAVVKGNKLLFTVKKGIMSKTITWVKQ